MANEKNLKPPFTPEQARELGRKGGLASAAAKKRRKAFRELLEEMLEEDGGTINGVTASRKEVATYNLIKLATASKGVKDNDRIKAFELIRDTIGEKPTEKVEVTKPTSETVKEMEEYFEQLSESDTAGNS